MCLHLSTISCVTEPTSKETVSFDFGKLNSIPNNSIILCTLAFSNFQKTLSLYVLKYTFVIEGNNFCCELLPNY